MKAGIVVYKRDGTSLVGKWSHAKIDGKLADETVHDVPAGALEGNWPVKISGPAGQLYFTGRLTSVKFGDCLKLAWTGTFPDGKPGLFEGIGYATDRDSISATFEEIDQPVP